MKWWVSPRSCQQAREEMSKQQVLTASPHPAQCRSPCLWNMACAGMIWLSAAPQRSAQLSITLIRPHTKVRSRAPDRPCIVRNPPPAAARADGAPQAGAVQLRGGFRRIRCVPHAALERPRRGGGRGGRGQACLGQHECSACSGQVQEAGGTVGGAVMAAERCSCQLNWGPP